MSNRARGKGEALEDCVLPRNLIVGVHHGSHLLLQRIDARPGPSVDWFLQNENIFFDLQQMFLDPFEACMMIRLKTQAFLLHAF